MPSGMNLLVHIFVWYFLVTSWWSVYRLTYCSLYYNGLGFFCFFGVLFLYWVVGMKQCC